MLVLGIETSCDETAAAIVENGKKILSNVVLSSLHLHKPYGGVVPEIASRHHAELIDSVIKQAFSNAGRGIKDIKLIAVTDKPGLIGALLVGISAAKGIALSNNIPLIGINHVWSHLYAPLMNPAPSKYSNIIKKRMCGLSRRRCGVNGVKINFPFIGLVVSGGHTDLIYVKGFDRYETLGRTTDDAVGEAFDKAAKILGLGFPGGPVIERLARKGNPAAIKFPKSLLEPGSLDFSFSGIKTAVLRYAQRNPSLRGHEVPEAISLDVGRLLRRADFVGTPRNDASVADICASFQEAVLSVIVEKSVKACLLKKCRALVAGGGVSINSRLREMLLAACKGYGINAHFPLRELCLDNAAMVAGLGYRLYRKGTHVKNEYQNIR